MDWRINKGKSFREIAELMENYSSENSARQAYFRITEELRGHFRDDNNDDNIYTRNKQYIRNKNLIIFSSSNIWVYNVIKGKLKIEKR